MRSAVAAPHVVGDRLRDRPLVERVAAARVRSAPASRRGADCGTRRRPPANGRRGGTWRPRRGSRARIGFDVLPLVRDDLAHRVTVARVSDRGLERAVHGDRAVAREQLAPAVDDPGNAHRQFAAIGDGLQAAALELFGRRALRRPAAGVQRVHALRLRVVDEREQVAADAVHRGFDDGEDGRGSDRGIEGVAPLLEDAQPRRRRQRLARGDHAVAREHDRARRARIRRGPVARALLRISSQERHAQQDDRAEDNRSHRISHHSSRIPECRPRSRIPESRIPSPGSRVPT